MSLSLPFDNDTAAAAGRLSLSRSVHPHLLEYRKRAESVDVIKEGRRETMMQFANVHMQYPIGIPISVRLAQSLVSSFGSARSFRQKKAATCRQHTHMHARARGTNTCIIEKVGIWKKRGRTCMYCTHTHTHAQAFIGTLEREEHMLMRRERERGQVMS